MSQNNFSNPPYSSLKNQFRNIMQKSISEHRELKIAAFSDKSEILSVLAKINAWEQCLEIFNKFCSMIEDAPPQVAPPPPASQAVMDGELVE